MAAPALEQLQEATEIEARWCANHNVHMSPEDRHLDRLGSFPDRSASEEFVQKVSSPSIDHGSAIERAPGQVKIELMGGHARRKPEG
jgi:hypothetical protein